MRLIITIALLISSVAALGQKTKTEPVNFEPCKGEQCFLYEVATVAAGENGTLYIMDDYYTCKHDNKMHRMVCKRRVAKTKPPKEAKSE